MEEEKMVIGESSECNKNGFQYKVLITQRLSFE